MTKNEPKTRRENGKRGGVRSAEDYVRSSDSGGLFRSAVAPDPFPADHGPHAGADEAEPVRPGCR